MAAVAILGVALAAALRMLRSARQSARDANRRASAQSDMRKLEHDASIQNDDGLADRITRRGL